MPAPAYSSGTLVNALLHRYGALSAVGRPAAAGHCPPPGPLHQRRPAGGQERRRAPRACRPVLRPRVQKTIWRWCMDGCGRGSGPHRTAHRARSRPPHADDRPTGPGRAAWSEYRVVRRFAALHLPAKSGSARGGPTRFARTWGPLAIRWQATRFTARRHGFPACHLWAAIFCTPTGFASGFPPRGEEITVESPLPAALAEWMEELDRL